VEHHLRKRFGDRVRALRQATGLSQEAFADHCGFARSYMSRIERGKSNVSLDAIEVLAIGLGVGVHELFISDQSAPATNKPAKPKPVLVPYAADGTCFHPGLRMKRTNQYRVGPTGSEYDFNDFQEALTYLRELEVACWRRPNAAGNWGVVKAVRWDVLTESN
jgi:transcriptional regulator with XRE-family HTH domain